MVSVVASSAVDRGFESRSGQIKDYESHKHSIGGVLDIMLCDRHLVDGTVRSVWFRQVFGLLRFSVYSGYGLDRFSIYSGFGLDRFFRFTRGMV
jgi:hypothetical protein